MTFLVMAVNFLVGTLCIKFGVSNLSEGLERANSKNIEKVVQLFSGKLLSSIAAGTLLTALVQSSTIIMIITIGFVNAGVMSFKNSIGIIYGANIGTTITAQLMSFNINYLSIPLLLLGIILKRIITNNSSKALCDALIGIGFMFLGLTILNQGVPTIKNSALAFELFKRYGHNPYISLIAGLISTMIVQSSSATVAITIILFNGGLIGYESALGFMLGDNIGTCITAQISSIGTSLNARRTAWAHTMYNVIGVLLALIFLPYFALFIQSVTSLVGQERARLIANSHTVFNILSALVFLPFTSLYSKCIEWLVPMKKNMSIQTKYHS